MSYQDEITIMVKHKNGKLMVSGNVNLIEETLQQLHCVPSAQGKIFYCKNSRLETLREVLKALESEGAIKLSISGRVSVEDSNKAIVHLSGKATNVKTLPIQITKRNGNEVEGTVEIPPSDETIHGFKFENKGINVTIHARNASQVARVAKKLNVRLNTIINDTKQTVIGHGIM